MAGERKQQILEALAKMLENPKREKITTAALAKKLAVSEAALYRHFATKAQMFEGLIEFIESSIFGVINQITTEEEDGDKQVLLIVSMLLRFAEKNPGMTRVLIGDALVNENERLQERINQLYDRIEVTLKQCMKVAVAESGKEIQPDSQANMMLCFVIGRWHQYAKSGFKRKPLEYVQEQLASML